MRVFDSSAGNDNKSQTALGSTGDIEVGNRVVSMRGRFIQTIGDVQVAANNLKLPRNGTVFHVTGNTQINLLSNIGCPQGGEQVTIIFDGTPTVKHNQASSGDYKTILLSGSVDFAAAANSTLTLVYDKPNLKWLEIGRKS